MLFSVLYRFDSSRIACSKRAFGNAGCAQVRGVDARERTSRLGGLPWCSGMMIACASEIERARCRISFGIDA